MIGIGAFICLLLLTVVPIMVSTSKIDAVTGCTRIWALIEHDSGLKGSSREYEQAAKQMSEINTTDDQVNNAIERYVSAAHRASMVNSSTNKLEAVRSVTGLAEICTEVLKKATAE